MQLDERSLAIDGMDMPYIYIEEWSICDWLTEVWEA